MDSCQASIRGTSATKMGSTNFSSWDECGEDGFRLEEEDGTSAVRFRARFVLDSLCFVF